MATQTKDQVRKTIIRIAKTIDGMKDVSKDTTKTEVIKMVSSYTRRADRTTQLKQIVEDLNKLGIMTATVKTPTSKATRMGVRLSASGYAECETSAGTFYLTIGVERESFELKPNKLKIAGLHLSVDELLKKVTENLDNNEDIPNNLKIFLLELMQKVYNNDKTVISSSDFMDDKYKSLVDTQFGEILGPGIVANAWGNKAKIKNIFFPKSEVAGLYDFEVTDENGNVHYYSSKQQTRGVTNTMKPQDLITLFNQQPASSDKTKLEKTKEYEIIKILGTNSIRLGGFLAVNKFPDYFKNGIKITIEKYKNKKDPEIFTSLKQNNVLPTFEEMDKQNEVAFIAERIIEEETKNNDEKKEILGRLMSFSLKKRSLYFCKFSLKKVGGAYSWEGGVVSPTILNEVNAPQIYIRGKGFDPPKERLGLTPP